MNELRQKEESKNQGVKKKEVSMVTEKTDKKESNI